MLKNGIYNLISSVIRMGLGIISIPLMVEMLGTKQYGLYSILLAIINLSSLSEWTVSVILTVFLSEDSSGNRMKHEDILRLVILMVLGFSLLTTLFLLIAAPRLANAFANISSTQQTVLLIGCRLASIIVVMRLLQQYFAGIEQALGRYKLLNVINTIFYIVQTLALIIGAWWYGSVIPLVIIQLIVSFVFVIVHAVVCYQSFSLVRFNWISPVNWEQFPSLLRYGAKTYVGVFGSSLFSQGDRLLVGKILGLEAAGIYSALTSIVIQINVLSAMPVQPLVPLVSAFVSSSKRTSDLPKKTNQLESYIQKAVIFNVTLSVGIGCCLLMLATEIGIIINRNTNFTIQEVETGLKVITVIYTLYSLNAVGYFILFAIKKEIINTFTTVSCGFLSLTIMWGLSQRFGLAGALVGNVGYILTLCLIPISMKFLQIPMKLFWQTTSIPLLTFIFTIVVSSSSDWSTIIRVAVLGMDLTILCVWFFFKNNLSILDIKSKIDGLFV